MNSPVPFAHTSTLLPERKRGFLLLIVLGFSVLMLVLGMAFLGTSRYRYETAVRIPQAAQARALAEAGIEDARVKFQKDIEFPPRSDAQSVFSYSEQVQDFDGHLVGSYRVTVDLYHQDLPYGVARLDSLGFVQDSSGQVLCTRRLGAEIDLAPTVRQDPFSGAPPVKNPRYFLIMNWKDYGTL